MKNFRKVLALILVVATLCSLTALASAKTTEDYKDADDVNYVDAVDVLSAIGILEGYTDGSFQPTKNIQREEMAKMVAVLSNAGDDVSDLYASACQFTDSKNSWAASYIAYCAQTGIVAGRSATTFDPDANVTGLETAKMLLVVLGFDATEQGYVGTNWKVNVLRDAKNFGLLNGFAEGYDVAKAITREEAAQMFLNALQAPLVVGTISNNVISISNAIYLDGSRDVTGLSRLNLTLKDAEKFGEIWTILYGNVVVSNVPLASIYKGLELNDAGQDCYGNPINGWSYSNSKGTVLFSKSYAVAPDYKYTTTASLAADLEEEIKSTVHSYTFDCYVDGKLIYKNQDLAAAADSKKTDYLKKVVAETGNGVLTQVFVDDVNYHVIITIKNTYIGEVAYITKQANTFTLTNGETYSNKDYGFEKGDIILYWICNGYKAQYTETLHDAQIAEPVSVTVSRTTTAGEDPAKSSITADGKKYEYAENFAVTAANSDMAGVVNGRVPLRLDNLTDPYFKLYLDEYGYIMLYRYDAYEYEYSYLYVVEGSGYSQKVGEDGYGSSVYESTADVVDFDANYKATTAVDRNVYDASVKSSTSSSGKNDYHGWWYYHGTGTLVRTYEWNGVQYLDEVAKLANVNAVLNKNGNIENENAKTLYGTEETKYLVRTWDYDKGEYVYTAFTGTLDQDYLGYVYNYYPEGATTTRERVATIQYFVDAEGFLDYVFVDAVFTRTSQRAYVTGYRESISDIKFYWDLTAVDAYNAVINGENSILLLAKSDALDEFPYLYEAELQAIGLTDEGYPVYSQVGKVDPRTDNEAYRWYKGILQVVEPGKEGNVYRIDENCFAVVTVEKSDGTLDTKVLESVADINAYFEELDSIWGQTDENDDPDEYNYIPVEGWVVETYVGSGVVSELYIVVK